MLPARRTTWPSPTAQPGCRILLVEDEALVRTAAVRALTGAGYEVHEANSAEAALDILDQQEAPPDLLLTDVILPRMDGAELAKQVQQRHPEVRVLFISGYSSDTFRDHGLEAEPPNLLQKPYTAKQLLSRVAAELVPKAMSSADSGR